MKAMKVDIRKLYTMNYLGIRANIEFIKVKDVPGFSHRVICNGEKLDWLSNVTKPSAKCAMFYYNKHAPTLQIKLDTQSQSSS